MSPALQPAPEPAKRAYHYAPARTAFGDGGGTPPQSSAGPFEIELSNDDRLKGALHKLVLVLPLTILIFEQALLHPDEKIKLPLVELELKINDVMPLFLMLISFMLYRALRYARIVLWTIAHVPRQMTTAGQIVLDNTDAYKMNSAYYEEVLDPMAAALVALWAKLKHGGWVSELSWNAWEGFNVLKSLIAYGFIFLLLGLMALYVSREFLSVLASKHIRLFDLHWLADPTAAIDVLILGVSALLLLMAWSNAATTILMAFWTVLRIIAKPVRWMFRLLFRLLYSLATRLRERHRDKKFVAETAVYNKKMEDFIATQPDPAEFRIRLKLFDAAAILYQQEQIAGRYMGQWLLKGSEMDAPYDRMSEWAEVQRKYRLTELWTCVNYLMVLAQKAPIEIVSSDARILQEKLQEIVKSYSAPPDDALLALLQRNYFALLKRASLSEAERQKAAVAVRKRLETIESKWDDIDSIERNLARIFKANVDQNVGTVYGLADAAEEYFHPGKPYHQEGPPIRGSHDSARITAFLAFLQRAAGLPSIMPA